jgi:hypothetical protein
MRCASSARLIKDACKSPYTPSSSSKLTFCCTFCLTNTIQALASKTWVF